MAADNSSLDQAIACHVEGQLDQALLLYLEALRLNPRDRTAAELVSAILRTPLRAGRQPDEAGTRQRSDQELPARTGHPARRTAGPRLPQPAVPGP